MDILDVLKQDHEKVKKILEQLIDTTQRAVKTREALFTEMLDDLSLHEQFEEEVFYPPLKEHPTTKDVALECYEEHYVAEYIQQQMADTDYQDETWIAKLSVLKENLEHHIREEESELFPKAKKVLDAEERKAMAEQLLQMKKDSK